jgi:hypothetical protein
VTTPKLAQLAVTADKIADGSITLTKLADLVVTAAKIANGTITEPKYADGSVGSRVIANSSVKNYHLDPSILLPMDISISSAFDKRGIDVTDPRWGAKGDGVTDDIIALQSAVDYGYLNKKSVYIPAGFYNISQELVIKMRSTDGQYELKDGITVYGDSKLTTIRKTTNSVGSVSGIDCCIVVIKDNISASYSGKEIYIRDINIEGNSLNFNLRGLFFRDAAFGGEVKNVQANNCKTGVFAHENHNLITYDSFTSYNCSEVGMDLYGSGFNTGLFLKDCYVRAAVNYGYKIRGSYSSMQNCAADGIQGTVYYFNGFNGTVSGCGTESINAYCMFEFDNKSRVTLTGCTGIANQYDKPQCRFFHSHNTSKVTVIGGAISSDLSGVFTQGSGSLFVIESNGFIDFINLNQPDLGFKVASDWYGQQKTKRNFGIVEGQDYYDPDLKKPIWKTNKIYNTGEYEYVDSQSVIAVKYPLLKNGFFEQSFTLFESKANFTYYTSPTFRITGVVAGSNTQYRRYTKINLTNFKFLYVRWSGVFGLDGTTNNIFRLGLLTPANINTDVYTLVLEKNADFSEVVQSFDVSALTGDYYLDAWGFVTTSVGSSIDVSIQSLILSYDVINPASV